METSDSSAPDDTRRFGGIARLYGEAGRARLADARVCVVGIGGVGSWAVEGLARSGIGKLTLIDLDHVAESNINRQIHASDATLGQAKVEAMRERIASYNPECRVTVVDDFVSADNVAAASRRRLRLRDRRHRRGAGEGGDGRRLPRGRRAAGDLRRRRRADRSDPDPRR
jgi:tRNA A37 threonylcarbamoyladenosine dehydratase